LPVFHKSKVIFIRVPKTASTSMHMALGRDNHDGLYHETISSIEARLKKETFNNYFKFAFVRNPWDWVLSWFYFKKTNIWHNEPGPDFSTWIENIGNIYKSRDNRYWYPGVEYAYSPNKKEFLSCGWRTCRAKIGYPCVCLMTNCQSDFICNKNREIGVDFVGRFESLQEDWSYVVKKTSGLRPKEKLGIFVKTNHKHYREEYTDKAAEVVSNLYSEDINTFEYKF
tara:strand:- start:205 stop:882 length:678 start_codon:yes stop_codon:yes gene_type:complete